MYEQYADDIFRYLYVRVRDRQLAEDLTADTFMRAWNNLEKFDFSKPRPWLYTIARNILTDHWRKKSTLPLEETEEPVLDDDMGEVLDTTIRKERVQAAVARLAEPMRSVVQMRFMLGYSAKKTAESLGLQENNVRIIQYRALRKMKGLLL
jgi:RNA polymerase sigma-70 factor (ECF subfamily)